MFQLDTTHSNRLKTLRKSLCCFGALLLCGTTQLDAQWVDISPVQTEYSDLLLFGADFYSDDIGLAVGQDLATSRGVVAHTTDGGQSWNLGHFEAEHLRGVGYFTEQSILVMGYDGPPGTKTLLHLTGDGGENWINAEIPQVTGTDELDVVGPTAAWAMGYGTSVGFSGGIMRTLDGGQSWDLKMAIDGTIFAGQCALDENTVFVAVTDFVIGAMFKTLDGGETWTQYNFDEWTEDVFFIDKNVGFVLARDKMYKTNDGGENWVATDISDAVDRIWFTSETTGYAIGNDGLAQMTEDGGESWTDMDIDTDYDLMQFAQHGDYLYAVGQQASVFRLEIGQSPTDVNIEAAAAEELLNMNVSPMPLASEGTLTYTLQTETRQHVDIALTDVAGRRVKTLVDSVHEPGEHALTLNLAAYPAGVWFLTATVNGQQSVFPLTIHR